MKDQTPETQQTLPKSQQPKAYYIPEMDQRNAQGLLLRSIEARTSRAFEEEDRELLLEEA